MQEMKQHELEQKEAEIRAQLEELERHRQRLASSASTAVSASPRDSATKVRVRQRSGSGATGPGLFLLVGSRDRGGDDARADLCFPPLPPPFLPSLASQEAHELCRVAHGIAAAAQLRRTRFMPCLVSSV